MAMQWSYNRTEIEGLCHAVMDGWTRQQLLDALIECETNAYIDRCELEYDESPHWTEVEKFEKLRLSHWNKKRWYGFVYGEDHLQMLVWNYAEENETCSNDFSEIYIDKHGYHTIPLPDESEVEYA